MRSGWRCGSRVYSKIGSFGLLRKKKAATAILASAPGGGSLASTGRSHQYLMLNVRAKKGVAAKQHDVMSPSVRRQCFYGERMNVGFHEVVDGGIDQPVAGDGGHPAKRLCNDSHPEMALAAGCTGIALVQITFILDATLSWSKASLQSIT